MFKRHENLAKWVAGLKGSKSGLFPNDFTAFYYAFLVGIKHKTREELPANAQDMLSDIPTTHNESKLHIYGLLLATYTEEMGLEIKDKKALKAIIKDLIKINERDGTWTLSAEGFKRVNQYAYAGFEIIQSHNKYATDPVQTIENIIELINSK
tara:strand:- start:530 stop:988 length:459 start_codon:yes stop_codon:yes gene_type:complete